MMEPPQAVMSPVHLTVRNHSMYGNWPSWESHPDTIRESVKKDDFGFVKGAGVALGRIIKRMFSLYYFFSQLLSSKLKTK